MLYENPVLKRMNVTAGQNITKSEQTSILSLGLETSLVICMLVHTNMLCIVMF